MLFCLLTACDMAEAIGEKGVVRTIFLDVTSAGQIEASLLVVHCVPNADTSQVETQASVCTGRAADAAGALRAAEKAQGRTLFYEQNRLLFLGSGATRNGAARCLSYFTGEDTARGSLSIYQTQLDTEAFAELACAHTDAVTDAERLTQQPPAVRAEALHVSSAGFSGCLPMLHFNENKESVQMRCDAMAVFADDKVCAVWRGLSLKTASLLWGESHTLSTALQTQEGTAELTVHGITVRRTVRNNLLRVQLCGRMDGVMVNGMQLSAADVKSLLPQVNIAVQRAMNSLYADTTLQGNDVFHETWWLRQEGSMQNAKLIAECRFR